ncbi:type V toxin-antitoxin system endoribonuclease antitoxin GhoS [Xenorhabdus bovienii]|uniref:type V toxin-antitoxin system endoribonuclease antitoxin GhoS n=1 Tax=Xenorhabdus bovienii TaxID=40576 RepID=UPI003DA44E41
MTRYLIRIELDRAASSEYEKLHESMELLKFYKIITGDDGRNFQLPQGTYSGYSYESSDQVLNRIKSVANPLSYGDAAIIVTKISKWSAWLIPSK